MTKPVVSDTGPLITLAKLNLLHLLERLYRRVYFPGSVYQRSSRRRIATRAGRRTYTAVVLYHLNNPG